MSKARRRARRVQVQGRGAMRRQLEVMRRAECCHALERCNAATATDIRLQYVDGLSLQHAPEIIERVAVLARRNVHAGWGTAPHPLQSGKIVRGDRFFEPG